jgi:hypothetical protein
MIRLLLRLLGIKDYEVCQSCETLKQQLAFVNDEKKQLTETLLSIVKPKTYEAPPIELNPVAAASGLFSRRRAAKELQDRMEAQILQEKKHLAIPDKNLSIAKLEQELGVEEGA